MDTTGPGIFHHVDEVPWIAQAEDMSVPGLGTARRAAPESRGKFLGGDDEHGPWFYYIEHKAGAKVPMHRHKTNRIEYVLDGEIEFRVRGDEPRRYGPNSYSYVVAGTYYEYDVLKDTKILVWFDGRPGISYAL